MAQVNQAYGVLGNPEKRAEYDRNRSTRLSPNGSWNTPVSSVWSTEPTARRSQDNTDYFTLGSTKDEISQIHGSPDNVNIYRNIGIELWNYEEDDHVEFDLATGLVQAWANITGNLRIRMLPGRNRTDAQFFTERDHRDQVAQLEGIPAAILIDRRLDRERWYYLNRGTVEFSHSTGLVSDWEDDGGLKAKWSKGSEGTYRNRSTAVRGESRPAFTSNWRSLGGKYNRNGIHVSDMTNPDCWLVVRIENRKIELFVMWPSQISHSDTVIVAWQLGNGHIRRQFWEVSASGASTFMPAHEVNDTIEAMRDARQMTVRVLPSAGRVITSSFDVRGFRDAIGWLIDTDRQKMSRGRLNHFTIGSSKSDVQTIHGPPMSVSQSSNGENWKYPGYSSVMFSSSTGGIVGWDNDSGYLKRM